MFDDGRILQEITNVANAIRQFNSISSEHFAQFVAVSVCHGAYPNAVEQNELIRLMQWYAEQRACWAMLELVMDCQMSAHFPVGNDEPCFQQTGGAG